MIDNISEFKVQYSDTDAYKVAWHGSYLRWMEAGRVEFLKDNGIDIKELDEKKGIVMPVVELKIKYKKSATLLDTVVVTTKAIEITDYYLLFEQVIRNKETNQLLTTATVKGVCVQNGKIMRDIQTLFGE